MRWTRERWGPANLSPLTVLLFHFVAGQNRRAVKLPGFHLVALAGIILALSGCVTARRTEIRHTGFIGLTNFSDFSRTQATTNGDLVLTSPEIQAPVNWDELVVSWNVAAGVSLKMEARGIYPDHATEFRTLGFWTANPGRHLRKSVAGQQDVDGTVKTDTLVMSRRGGKVQLRLTMGGTGNGTNRLKFVGLCFSDGRFATGNKPNKAAWGRVLDVPERRQGEYPGGGGWCSPVSLSMVLAYWGQKLQRPELDCPVPEVANDVFDAAYRGTGNWSFNVAYAGGIPGMRAYVARLNDLSEVEDWIAAGVPVVLSTSSYLARDPSTGPDNGHLIVCAGFTETGDVVANDPGVSVKRGERARRVFARDKVIAAWKKSRNTAYLVYPEGNEIPGSGAGDWERKE